MTGLSVPPICRPLPRASHLRAPLLLWALLRAALLRASHLRAPLLLWALLLPTALALLAGPAPAASQQVEREVQVPIDPEREVVEIDAELRRELGLFPGVEGFVAARLFETADGSRVLEVTFREEGRTVRERRTLGAAELDALRARIVQGLEARGMERAVRSDGRGGLVIAETVLGLGFYGFAVPEALDIDSSRGALAAYLLTAGASFYLPYRLTRSIPVTPAHRDAVVWGATRGIVYGMLVADALTLGDDDDLGPGDFPEPDDDSRAIWGLGLATSVGGSILGYRMIDPSRHDRGDVALWSTGGDLALAYGFGTALALGLYDADPVCRGDACEANNINATTAGHLVTAGVGLAGFWGARRWAEAEDYTVGDARALLSFGVLGGQLALPLAWAILEDTDDDEKGIAASLIAGSATGLWLGNRQLRRRALTSSDGLLVQAGHLAGGALAAGLTYLLDGGRTADELVYMTTTALGSVAGSLLTFRAVADDAPAAAGQAPGRGGGTGDAVSGGGPTVEVGTVGLLTSLLARDARRPVRVPLVTIRH